MGSNSFRLEVGRVEGDQIYRLDTQREMLRIGAGLDNKGNLTANARRAALACLARFGERLAGLHSSAVCAVATNTFRVARNAHSFLVQAQRALGFPIESFPATRRRGSSTSVSRMRFPLLLIRDLSSISAAARRSSSSVGASSRRCWIHSI
jgi:hypothetical protein